MITSKKVALGIILSSATLTIMAGSIIAPILNLMRVELNVARSSVGMIITTHGLLMALFSPLMGSIIDRKGVKSLYVISLLFYGLAGGSGLVINSFWVLIFSRACLGIGLAGIFSAINVLILNMYDGKERDKVMGWRGSAQSMGGIIWPLAGGALGGLSWHFPFAVYMVAIPIGFFAFLSLPNDSVAPAKTTQTGNRLSVFQLFRKVSVLPVILGLTFSASVLLYAIVIFMPQMLDTFGISNTFLIGIFIAIMTGSGGVVSFFYGRIRNHLSYKLLILLGSALWTLSFTCLFLATNPLLIAIAVSIFGISQGLIMPTVMVWIGDVVPVAFRGRISAYLGTAGFIGQFFSPIIFAPILVRFGLKGVFLTGTVAASVWLLFNLLYFIQSRKTEQAELSK